MRRECRELFPDHAGKGSLLSSYQAETGLLLMWAGLSCFLSSGDGYVGELFELQPGSETLRFKYTPYEKTDLGRHNANLSLDLYF